MIHSAKLCIILIVIAYAAAMAAAAKRGITLRDVQRQAALAKRGGFRVTLSVLPVIPVEVHPSHRRDSPYGAFVVLIDYLASHHAPGIVSDTAPLESDKISVKLMQLSDSPAEALALFDRLAAYARDRGVFVWISAVTRDTLGLELACYERARAAGRTNVGLTVASYHRTALATVQRVLRIGGHVRLVKGHYSGDIDDWGAVTANFAAAAKLLIASGTAHTLATHDFDVLRQLDRHSPRFAERVELAFYHSALPYVARKLEQLPFATPHTALYMAHGDYLKYVVRNIGKVDTRRYFGRALNGAFYDAGVC